MRYLILIYIILTSTFTYSQSMKIIDYETNKPIPYATVLITLEDKIVYGDYCNEEGLVYYNNNKKIDNVEVTCIGYEKNTINLSFFKDTIISLKKSVYNLDEVIVTNVKKKITTIGISDEKKISDGGISKGMEQVLYIENKFKEAKYIKSFLFKVKKTENRVGYRIHIYKELGKQNLDDVEILKEDVVRFIEPKTKGTIEVDLSEFNIELPLEGVYIGIEALGFFNKNNILINNFNSFLSFEFCKSDKSTSFFRNKLTSRIWTNSNDFSKENYRLTFNKELTQLIEPSFSLKIIE